MVHRSIQRVFILLIFLCGAQVAWSETSNTSSFATIEFTQPLHFLAVDGSNVLIPPGNYQVEAAEEWLRLVPSSQVRADAWLIEAHASIHEEPLDTPKAISVQDEASPNVHRLVLLFPDGTSLEAVGSSSGVRSRGMTRLRTPQTTGPRGKVKVETTGSVFDPKIQIYLDRLDIISDGDRVGAGEVDFLFAALYSSPRCPKDPYSSYKLCDVWRYHKQFKAKSGDVKYFKHTLPGAAQYVSVQSGDAVHLFMDTREHDPSGPFVMEFPIYNLGIPIRALTRANGGGIGSHTAVFNDGRAGKKRFEVKLHYRVTSWQPDLKIEDFWTVPRVPNPGYEKTRVCVKVANIGNAPSSSFDPRMHLDDMHADFFGLSRQGSLPASGKPGNRQTYCGMMPTPGEGKHRLGVRLRTTEFDHKAGNNWAEKELVSQKRMTHEEAWQRVWGQVTAFGDQVRQLKTALGLNGAALPRLPKGIRPVSWHSSTVPTLFNESGMFHNSSGKMLWVAGPSRLDKRKGFKKSPPRRARQNQQELLQFVSNIRNRAVNIQSEAQMLRGAYLDLKKEAAAEKTAELIGVAKQLYGRCLALGEAIRDTDVPKIEEGVSILNDGHQNMANRLKLLRKF